VLVVEDDPAHALLIEAAIQDLVGEVTTVRTRAEALRALALSCFDLVLIDAGLPDGSGFDLQTPIAALRDPPPIVFVTSDDLAEHAVRALRAGAVDYVVKRPSYLDRLRDSVIEQVRRPAANGAAHALLGDAPAMLAVRKLIARYGASQAAVLILGETGTGKELVARALHGASSRAEAPFVALNCAAVSTALFESELFGSLRGSYTGSQHDREGLVQAASGGTLFLDEVGELPRDVQAKLLRFLESHRFRPVGATAERTANVRLLAATNSDLRAAAGRGEFRSDLYFRLNVLQIRVPPLRERPEDIPVLVDHFLREDDGPPRRVAPEAMRQLRSWSWPGNVRELRHAVQRTLAQSEDDVIAGFDLAADRPGTDESGSVELRVLEAALVRHAGRLAPVAAELGFSVRTVQRRIKDCGLHLGDYRRGGRGAESDA
jgi:two-component system response regulator PilR (NtrC family)